MVGPYTSINATLTLVKSETRIDSNSQLPYPKDENTEDLRFRTRFAATQSIATSHAQNDSGMFELNFRDERYLPFEGAGAISEWRLELPKDCNAFDFNTISDVILHLKYTVRDGGAVLAQKARDAVLNVPPQQALRRLFSVRNEFSNEWHRFLHPGDTAANVQRLTLPMTHEHFPFMLRNKEITLTKLTLFLKPEDAVDVTSIAVNVSLGHKDPANANNPVVALSGDSQPFVPMGDPWGNVVMCEFGNLALDLWCSTYLEPI